VTQFDFLNQSQPHILIRGITIIIIFIVISIIVVENDIDIDQCYACVVH